MNAGIISEVDVREAGLMPTDEQRHYGGSPGREGFSGNGFGLTRPILGYPPGVDASTLFFSWRELCNGQQSDIPRVRSNGQLGKGRR